MTVIVVTWTEKTYDAPEGTVGGDYAVNVAGQSLNTAASPASFTVDTPTVDTVYPITVQRLDINGVPTGPVATGEVTITVNSPVVVTVPINIADVVSATAS